MGAENMRKGDDLVERWTEQKSNDRDNLMEGPIMWLGRNIVEEKFPEMCKGESN